MSVRCPNTLGHMRRTRRNEDVHRRGISRILRERGWRRLNLLWVCIRDFFPVICRVVVRWSCLIVLHLPSLLFTKVFRPAYYLPIKF